MIQEAGVLEHAKLRPRGKPSLGLILLLSGSGLLLLGLGLGRLLLRNIRGEQYCAT